MNNNKLSRIASFIEGLPIDDSLGDCQSTLLAANMDYIGAGGTNNGDCINEMYKQCNKSKNYGSCKNYNSACSDTTNGADCRSTPEKPIYRPDPVPVNCC